MGLPKPKEYWTVEEYLEFEKTSSVRHEFVDGEIYAMADESKNHNRLAGRVFSILDRHLAGGPCEAFIENVKVKVRPPLYYYPDVVVTCEPADIVEDDNAGEDWTKQVYSSLQSQIYFDSIGVEVSLADIYRRVRFPENILEIEREER